MSSILHVPQGYSPTAKHYLIFFITGNPGFLGYYRQFLQTLRDLLYSDPKPHKSGSDVAFHIFSQSLPGFEDSEPIKPGRTSPYGLLEVIDHTFNLLQRQRISVGERKGQAFDGVILMGHSVGAYIALEVARRIREQSNNAGSQTLPQTPTNPKIDAAILLFPTVTHLELSPSGVKFGWLFRLPDAPRRASWLAGWLLWPLPRNGLKWLVGTVLGMPEDGAGVTAEFLRSKRGVWQAL
jgi:pimeloyl-ACP methyl ester carboxylesterase